MTLAEQSSFVCVKVNQTEVEDIAACNEFLKRRAQMLWADQLWKDSLVEYVQTLSPTGYTSASNWLPTKGVLLLPSDIERVIAVRSDTGKLNVQSGEFYYRRDFDVFAATGTPLEYTLLPPCVWETDVDINWALYSTTVNDQASFAYLNSDGINLMRVESLNIQPVLTFTSQRLDSLSYNTQTDLTVADLAGGLNLNFTDGVATAPKRQRVRIIPVPAAQMTIRVLGKRKLPGFEEDTDEFALTGADNALLAFDQGDMLQRERYYAKAQVCNTEGGLLLEQLKRVETVQQAHNKRIVPAMGLGPDYFQFPNRNFIG
jgi:hypothetical protein